MQYAGDVTSLQAWELLSSELKSVLVDVRTAAEMNFVGVPDLAKGKYFASPLYELPDMQMVPEFIHQLKKIDMESKIFFLCRSGGRSRDAAIIATQAGFKECYNVVDGFEGPVGPNGHRGTVSGWKAVSLPWRQN